IVVSPLWERRLRQFVRIPLGSLASVISHSSRERSKSRAIQRTRSSPEAPVCAARPRPSRREPPTKAAMLGDRGQAALGEVAYRLANPSRDRSALGRGSQIATRPKAQDQQLGYASPPSLDRLVSTLHARCTVEIRTQPSWQLRRQRGPAFLGR